MAESVSSAAVPSAYAHSLGDPDAAILRLVRRAWFWLVLYGLYLCVVACFVVGKYPATRTIASAALLLGVVPAALLVLRTGRPDTRQTFAEALLWVIGLQCLVVSAITGGLHSPHALVLFMAFSSLYARYGRSRAGATAFAVFCGGVVALALAPASWTGPTLGDPWFSIAAVVATIGAMGLNTGYVDTLRRTAADGVQAALQAREELAEGALARARELELVGSRLSHEIKNPLAAIKALVQLAHRSAREPVLAKQLGVVEQEIERMAAVVQSHLGFSRPFDRIDRVDIQLGEVADSVLALLEGRSRAAGVTLHRRGDARADVDPQRLRGALVNLVANAIEACQGGGRVEIAIEGDDAVVRLSVIDDGAGMPPDVLERVGTPFFTTRQRGTGLGVLLARTVFEQHGGTLEFRSAAGQGTTAIGHLPRSRSRAAEGRMAAG